MRRTSNADLSCFAISKEVSEKLVEIPEENNGHMQNVVLKKHVQVCGPPRFAYQRTEYLVTKWRTKGDSPLYKALGPSSRMVCRATFMRLAFAPPSCILVFNTSRGCRQHASIAPPSMAPPVFTARDTSLVSFELPAFDFDMLTASSQQLAYKTVRISLRKKEIAKRP